MTDNSNSKYLYIGKDSRPILARVLEDQRDELQAKLDKIVNAWEIALYGDLEHGVSSLNKRVVDEFVAKFPNIAAFNMILEDIIHGKDDTQDEK